MAASNSDSAPARSGRPSAQWGGPTRSPGEAVDALAEAIDVIRLMWSTESSVRFDGRHYQLSGVKPGPQPAHDLGIWLGVRGRRTLALLGKVADGWVPSSPWAPPARLPAFTAQIDDAAAAAGRDPAVIRRVYNMFGSIRQRGTDGFLQGTVEQWTDELTMLAVEHGIDSFVFGPADDPIRQVPGLRRRRGAGSPRRGRPPPPCARNRLSLDPRRARAATTAATIARSPGEPSGPE